MADSFIRMERDGDVAIVTLDRPQKLNALTPSMLGELESIARAIDADTQLRAVVLTGAGSRAFCAGADISEWSSLKPLDMWRFWVKRGHDVFEQWARLRQPVVVAINGHTFGGGLELAIVGDVRIAAANVQFALPEASISTCPGWSGTQRLVQLIGASYAKYLALTGTRINAADALRCGLIHEVAEGEELFGRALALARTMAEKAPIAIQLTKQLVNSAAGEGRAFSIEAMAGALAATTADAAEGLRSFTEKRAPQYIGS